MSKKKIVIIFYADVISNLKNCDWTQIPDVELSDEKKEKWKLYRKELRRLARICKGYMLNNITKADLTMPLIPDNEKAKSFINILDIHTGKVLNNN